MRPRLATVFFMAALFALGLPRPVTAVTFDIPDGDVAGLVAAINSANANGGADTIRLADRGTYVLTVPDPMGGPDGPTGLPSITSPIVIDGSDATIQRSTTDGTPDFRILTVAAAGDLTLNKVIVRHGRAVGSVSQDCGGIRLERNGRLTLNRSLVSNNYASFAGGGICARSDSVLVINESVVANNVAVDGGGIFIVDRAAMDVIDSTISGNSADFGGGIFNDNGAESRIIGSTISDNTATRWGGGIGSFSFGPAPDFGTRLTISDSLVSGNFGGEGGGIFSNIGVVEVTTSIISNNTTGRGGAAITNSRSVFSVNDSCIFENPSTSVFNDAAAPVMDATDNWWGAADGPSGVGSGSGDAVSSNVEFAPFRTSAAPVCATVAAALDIKPGSDRNSTNPRAKGKIPVAILTDGAFDALQVDPTSVRFGPDEASIAHAQGHVEDVDGDGDSDLLLHFRTRETGIACGDIEASVTAETYAGQLITSADVVNTVGCGKK